MMRVDNHPQDAVGAEIAQLPGQQRLPPIWTSGLGTSGSSSASRVPRPAARIIAFTGAA